jgi:arginyl-tRNA synthetase
MAGWLQPPRQAVHVAFGSVLGDDRKMLRSRAGASVKLVDLLDEAVDRAAAAIEEKNPELDPATRERVANMVGIGAIKYADLSTDRVKDYVFDFDRMLAFEGNTGPYLQYAHARICSIFRREGIDRASVRAVPIELVEPQERALALQVLAFPTAIDAVLENYQPHKLCTYVFDVATAFSAFYEHCRIKGSPEPTYSSRLALADATALVLERALGLLGIDAPDQM